jgi:1-phosphatidylinositol-3-phosphate 5-kinase
MSFSLWEHRTNARLSMTSFGKFIELEVYSRQLQVPPSKLCEHVEENILRLTHNFAFRNSVLILTRLKTSTVMDIQIPWLHLQRTERSAKANSWSNADQDVFQYNTVGQKELSSEDVALLTRQITDWFGGLTNHLTKVVRYTCTCCLRHSFFFQSDTLELFQGDILLGGGTPSSVPAEQSSWDHDENTPTPKPGLVDLPPSVESLISKDSLSLHSDSEAVSTQPSDTGGPLVRLEKLKDQTQRKQQELLQLMRMNPLTRLNDIRRKFRSEARQFKRMIEAWLDKYFKPLNLASGQHLMHINLQTPDWWDSKCHVVPGSRFVVKDGDLGTIIASALGSVFSRFDL